MSEKDKSTKAYQIGERFQNETKYTPETLNGYMLDWKSIPEPFKEYKNPIERVSLPEPKPVMQTSGSSFSNGEHAGTMTHKIHSSSTIWQRSSGPHKD